MSYHEYEITLETLTEWQFSNLLKKLEAAIAISPLPLAIVEVKRKEKT